MSTATNCKACKKSFGIFRWRYICDYCEKTFCDDCLSKIPSMEKLHQSLQLERNTICQQCYTKRVSHIFDKYNAAIIRGETIDIWPITYKGKIPIIIGSEKEPLLTSWQKGKSKAMSELKTTLAYLYEDCDSVVQMECKPRSASSGNYKYTEWQATGIPAKRK